jgi:hypothetical protein
MDPRTWLTSNVKHTTEGELAAVCVRLFAMWALLIMPLVVVAAFMGLLLPAEYRALIAIPIAMGLLLYVWLLRTGIRVFADAEDQNTEAWLFTVLEIACYVGFAYVILRDGGRPLDEWGFIALAIAPPIAIIHMTHILIALCAKVPVKLSAYGGFAAAVGSCFLAVRGFLS